MSYNVKVEQRDREAAAAWWNGIGSHTDDLDRLNEAFARHRLAERDHMAPAAGEVVEEIARTIHAYCARNMVMTYLDAEEDCEGLARAIVATLKQPVAAMPTRQELVEVLREAQLQLEYLDERFPTGTTPTALTRIDALLAQVNEGREG